MTAQQDRGPVPSGGAVAIRRVRDRRWSLVRHRRRIARAVIAVIVALLGVAQGIVWARIAPGEQVMVYTDGSYLGLPTADYHPFDGLAIMAFAGSAVGLIVAVAAWRVRAVRGAVTLGALAAGSVVGSVAAYVVGVAVAGGVDPATVGALAHASIVVAGPNPGTWLVVLVEPLFAVATYTFLAAWDGRADLGASRATRTPATDAGPVGPLQREADEGAEPVGHAHGDESAADIAEHRAP